MTRESFPELVQYFGSAPQIPNEALYHYLNDSRDELIKAGAEQVKQSNLGQEVRRRSKQDLAWMACYFTWETNPFCDGQPITENRVTEISHAPVFNLFVKKDDSKKLFDQDSYKKRLLLWPRNGMKSTIDVVDGVQWILNFPSVRILYFTGDDDLAVKFVTETKGHFVIKPSAPSLMNLFFPEFCIDESRKESQFEFTCPVWQEKALLRGEPTVQASSIGSGLGGRHYDVIKADDAVYDRNSETEELCQKVAKKISLTIRPGKMLMHRGYLDIVGTRYHEEDYYGGLIEKNVGDLVTTGSDCWTMVENKTTKQYILVAKGVVIKPDVLLKLEKEGRQITYQEAGESGCSILLPDIMPYSFLMGEYADNEETFESQINQNPKPQSEVIFDRGLMLRSTIRFDEMPFSGPVSQTWDFAGPFHSKKGRDYCTASTALWNDKGVCFIQDIIRDRFKPADLAKAVVDFAAKYRPFVIGVENAGGAEMLEPAIIAEAKRRGDAGLIAVCSKIDWITPDNRKDAKKSRIKVLHPLLVQGQMKFASYLPFLNMLYDEFEKCLHSSRHDDIPDVISYQPRYTPRVMQLTAKQEMPAMSHRDVTYNLLYGPWLHEGDNPSDPFGRIGFGAPAPIIPSEPEPEVETKEMYPGIPNFLGSGF